MTEEEAFYLINTTPALQSILYDCGMLPEQQMTEGSKQWFRVMAYALAYQAGVENTENKPLAIHAEIPTYMDDKELLELAAKAAGMYVLPMPWPNCDGWFFCEKLERPALYFRKSGDQCPNPTPWMPLDDDGDALRLAVKLNIAVFSRGYVAYAEHGNFPGSVQEPHNNNPYAAIRRVIVRAAASIAND